MIAIPTFSKNPTALMHRCGLNRAFCGGTLSNIWIEIECCCLKTNGKSIKTKKQMWKNCLQKLFVILLWYQHIVKISAACLKHPRKVTSRSLGDKMHWNQTGEHIKTLILASLNSNLLFKVMLMFRWIAFRTVPSPKCQWTVMWPIQSQQKTLQNGPFQNPYHWIMMIKAP